MGVEHFGISKGKGRGMLMLPVVGYGYFSRITHFKTKKYKIMFIPNKNTSHLACVSESGAAASQIEHGG